MAQHQQTDVVNRNYWREEPTRARSRIIREYGDLVSHVARRAKRRFDSNSVEEGDLFQIGALGLFEAVDNFDPELGSRFEAFASYRIEGSIRDYLRSIDPVPARTRRALRTLDNAHVALSRTLKRTPTVFELAEETGWTCERVREIQRRSEWHATPLFESDWETEETPEHEYLETEKKELLADAFLRIATQKRKIIKGLFLEGRQGKDIAEEIGVTPGRVSQLKAQALEELREIVRGDFEHF